MREILRSRRAEIATEAVAAAPVPKECYEDHIDGRGCKPLTIKNLLQCTLAAVCNPL
jgi:hypothetical protein